MEPARRYRDLIRATVDLAVADAPPSPPSDPQPIAALLPLLRDDRPVEFKGIGSLDFIDGAGHRRPPYRGIALRQIARRAANAESALRKFVATSLPTLQAFADAADPLTAAIAGGIQAVIFDALAIESAASATSHDRAIVRRCFERLCRNQQPDGTFLARTRSDNLEPLWYAELALLHATHLHATEQSDPLAAEAAGRAAAYLAAEVQPDHASSHPWAIAALLALPDGIALADTMLHVAGVQSPRTMDAVSLLLLADAIGFDPANHHEPASRCEHVAGRG